MAAGGSLQGPGEYQERKFTVYWAALDGLLSEAMKPPSLKAFKIRLDQAMLNELIYSWQ